MQYTRMYRRSAIGTANPSTLTEGWTMETQTLDNLDQTHGTTDDTVTVRHHVRITRMSASELDAGIVTSALTEAQCDTYLRIGRVVFSGITSTVAF